MKRLITFILSVLLLLSLCACADTDKEAAPSNIYLQDYEQLWTDLHENYPFFPLLESQGIDVNAVYKQYLPYAENSTNMPQFMDVLDLMFAKLQCFAHLSLIRRDRYELMQASLSQYENFEPWLKVLNKPATAAVYAQMPEAETGSFTAPTANVEFKYYPDIFAAYFRFPSMLPDYAAHESVIADKLSGLERVEHIIIDVTGNPGGSTAYWDNVIVRPFGGNWQSSYRVFYQASPINDQYYSERALIPIDGNAPAFAAELNAKYYEVISIGANYGPAATENGTEAKRWVLIDSRGYSATEHFAAFCKLTGWASLVGESTGGDGLGGQPVLLPLKNTGLLIYFSSAMGENPDGSLNTAQGVKPDYPCPPKEDISPLEYCLKLIKEASA